MAEVLGQYFSSKADNIDDNETNIIFVPANNLLVLRVLASGKGTSRI
jgi:hypothetical protein